MSSTFDTWCERFPTKFDVAAEIASDIHNEVRLGNGVDPELLKQLKTILQEKQEGLKELKLLPELNNQEKKQLIASAETILTKLDNIIRGFEGIALSRVQETVEELSDIADEVLEGYEGLQ
ncbi:hypothetical protein L211DRAFT_847064 [Terfezia boudieri ATCC MYA-4762]|uniref:Uncharacterized protein n=1 Tax=Terfezia boudieri ATCC MYA-4762 TaxID=1051890 RepID=A0A3N4LU25_9PEZI|nr:hypothetical protein L211DRAFT_847064 [Terfezia boudieri ATCC MYA-4762]